MVMPNLYGGILSNIASGITGGAGVTPGANIGDKYALFETGTRHRGGDLAGKDTANPTGMLLTTAMMLRRLNFPHFADAIERSLRQTLEDHRTKDLGGKTTTSDFVKRILGNLYH